MRHQHRDLSILDFPLAYGKIIPDVSAQKLAAINAWRDARALIRCERISNLAATGASLCCSHHRGVCDYVLVSRARTSSPIGFAPKFIELVGLSRRLPNRVRCVDRFGVTRQPILRPRMWRLVRDLRSGCSSRRDLYPTCADKSCRWTDTTIARSGRVFAPYEDGQRHRRAPPQPVVRKVASSPTLPNW